MEMNKLETLQELTRLSENPATRQWELTLMKQAIAGINNGRPLKSELSQLEFNLRPLALRNNLTPAVADFYLRLTDDPAGYMHFDYSIHFQQDPPFQERAIFSGGCFWCLVEPFDTRPGITSVISGYTGGKQAQPTYEEVSSHQTNHVEAVEIIFDSRKITYQDILTIFWNLIDPTDAEGQFDDRGNNYRPAIFYSNEKQRLVADQAKKKLQASGQYSKPIIVPLRPATAFWPAENYHQDFYKKFKSRYRKLRHTRNQILFWQHLRASIRSMFKKTASHN